MRHALARPLPDLRRWAVGLALAAILLLGFGLRDLACRWSLPYLLNWDEPFVANRALQILRTGEFNPRFFNYGSLTLYLDAAVDALHYYALVTLPEEDPNHLRTPQEIRFRGAREDELATDPGHPAYWISHPSFYLWNRRLTALFGTAGIAFAFLIARRLAGPLAGLVAAFALAVSGFHIEQSALVTTDVPAATLALAALFLTLGFVQGERARWLVGAFALVGLAAGTKYNAALFALVPLVVLAVAAVRHSPGYRPGLWLAAPAAGAGAFLAATPYALLDLPTFLHHSGRMLSGYVVRKDQLLTVAAGWPHLRLDLETLARNWSAPLAVAIAIGLLLALRRPAAWVVLPIGAVVLLATSRTLAPFHRNLVVCYPLAAIALGLLARDLVAAGRWRLPRAILAAGLGLALLSSAAAGLGHARRLGAVRDTRTALVDHLNQAGREGLGSVAIAAELGVHDHDLARLELPYEVAPIRTLVCAPAAAELVVLPVGARNDFEENRDAAARLGRLLSGAGTPREAIRADRPLSIDTPVTSPGLGLFAPRSEFVTPLACAEEGVDLDALAPHGEVWRNPKSLGLAASAAVETPELLAPAGRSLASIQLAALEQGALAPVEVQILGRDGALLHRFPTTVSRERATQSFYFELPAETPIRLRATVAPDSPAAVLLYGLWLAPAAD